MKTAIHIGSNKESIEEAGKVIINILNTSNDQDTKRVAIESLSQICQVNNTTLSHCVITVNEKEVKEQAENESKS